MSPTDPPPGGPSGHSDAPKSWRSRAKKPKKEWRWQRDVAKDRNRAKTASALRWRAKVAVTGLFLLVVLGAYIGWLIVKPPRTPVVALLVTDYAAPIPPNSWALEDVEALKKHAELKVTTLKLGRDVDKVQLREELKQQLQKFRQSPSLFISQIFWGKPPVIVYVSMHGLVDGAGNACLLPPGKFKPDDADWLPVSDLLEDIKNGFDGDEDRQILLVLDCTRIDVNWQLGVLYNGFAEALQAAVAKAAVPNLVVLSASSPGQVAWDSPDLRQSVFGYYFFRGLQNEEIGQGFRKRVHLQSLVDYLKKNIELWVKQNRGAVQTPVVLNEGELVADASVPDIPLVWVPKKPKELVQAPIRSFEADLNRLWEEHSKLRAEKNPYRDDPLGWQECERLLLRLEQLNRAGRDYEVAAVNTRDAIDEWLKAYRARVQTNSHLVAHSWPMAVRLGLRIIDERMTAWQAFSDDPKPATARAVFSGTSIGKDVRPGDLERHFAWMLDQFLDDRAWSDAGKAAATLHTAEEAAAPGDERAQYWIRSDVDQGDQKRRVAEDHLFVGNDDALTVARKAWQDANGHYGSANAQRTLVENAYALRDQVLAELPYYAQWRTRRLPRGAQQDPLDDVLQAIHTVHDLAEALDPTDSPEVRNSEQLKRAYTSLNKVFNTELNEKRFQRFLQDRLAEARLRGDLAEGPGGATKRNQTTLRGVAALLKLPMVTGDDRKSLREYYRAVAEQLNKDTLAGGPATSDEAKPDYLDQIREWQKHPALLLVGRAVKEPDRIAELGSKAELLANLASGGRQLRQWLYMEVDEQIGQDLKETESQLQKETVGAEQLRGGRSRADRLARVVSALRKTKEPNPIAALRKLDQHNLMIWHGWRAADDFWGPVSGQQQQQFFFKLAGDRYCDAAVGLEAVASDKDLQNRLSDLQLAAVAIQAPANQPEAKGITRLDEDEERIPHSITLHPPSSLPKQEGAVAAVYVLNSDGASLTLHTNNDAVARIAVPLNSESTTTNVDYELEIAQLGEADDDLRPVWLFRGHRAAGSFPWKTVPRFELTHVPPELSSPTIRVDGPAAGASVSFILDCSYSMRRPLAGREGGESTLMKVAASTLKSLLKTLAANGQYEVAVRFYGHRMRYPRRELNETGNQPLPNPSFPVIPANLIPPNDVELVLPMDVFNEKLLADMEPVLDRVGQYGAWGQTPLYRAIVDALNQDFEGRPNGRERIVFVITDGANYQSPGFETHNETSVMDAWKARSDVSIYGVEFKVDAQDQEELDRFREIVRETGGRRLPANNEQELRKALLLQFQYEVVPPRGKGEIKTQPFGDEVKNVRPGKDYEVHLEANHDVRQRFDLEEGRKLELRVSDDRRQLRFREFRSDPEDRGTPDFGDANGGKYRIGFHTPIVLPDSSGTRFRFSIQDADGDYTSRPVEIWTEIQPVTSNGRQHSNVYPFYHTDWVDKRPVPVWDCVVPEWPEGFRDAKVRIWCSMGEVLPEKEAGQTVAQLDGHALKVGGATFVVERKQGRIQVIERHDRATDLFDRPMKVWLHPPEGGPLRASIRRRYYDDRAVHTFLFDQSVRSDDIAKYKLHIIQRESIENVGFDCSRQVHWDSGARVVNE